MWLTGKGDVFCADQIRVSISLGPTVSRYYNLLAWLNPETELFRVERERSEANLLVVVFAAHSLVH